MLRVSLLLVMAMVVARSAGAQPFIYSIKNDLRCELPGGACEGPRLLVTNTRTGELVNPDDPELHPASDGSLFAFAVSIDGTRLYAGVNTAKVGFGPGRLLVISAATLRPIEWVAVPNVPWVMLPSPDGRVLYTSNPLDGVLLAIDTATHRVTRKWLLESAFDLASSADGSLLAVAQPRSGSVTVLETATGAVRFRATVPTYPQRIAISGDGRRIYVATANGQTASGAIVTIDIVTGAVTPATAGPWQPSHLLNKPDDSKVYVTFGQAGAFGVVSPSGEMTVIPADVRGSASMVPSKDWRRLYIERTDGILVIDTATDTVVDAMPGGGELNLSGPCDFVMPVQDAVFGPAGGTGAIVVPAPAGCEWAVQRAPADGIQFRSPTNGIGPGTLSYSVASSAAPRALNVRIAGQTTRLAVRIPRLVIDTPAQGAVVQQRFHLGGWTLEDAVGADGAGVDVVHAWAVPVDGSAPVFLGAPAYGAPRPDVAAAYGTAYGSTGFNLTVPWLKPARYHIAVYGRTRGTGTFAASHVVTVTVEGENLAMSLDAPREADEIDAGTPSIYVGGWAIDRSAPTGTGVDLLHVWAFPIGEGAPRFLGAVAYGYDRPDVGALMGSAYRSSGFSSLLPKPPPGTYWIAVYARSTVSSQFDQWRVVRMTIRP